MKTISILIAAYQAQEYVQDCLNSVFSQQLPNGWKMQVLLGIDGCDDTLKATETISYPDLGIVYLQKNHGTYITFNTLMAYATGELICRFDADDVMQPDYLRAHILSIGPDVDMAMSWSIYTDVNLQATSHVMAHEFYHPANGLNRRAAEGQFVIKREVWQRLGGFRAWRCSADTDFLNRIQTAGFKPCTIEQFLYLRRTHENSLTAHPDTNFKSPLRKSIQQLNADYLQQYKTGERSLKIQPESAADHVKFSRYMSL